MATAVYKKTKVCPKMVKVRGYLVSFFILKVSDKRRFRIFLYFVTPFWPKQWKVKWCSTYIYEYEK